MLLLDERGNSSGKEKVLNTSEALAIPGVCRGSHQFIALNVLGATRLDRVTQANLNEFLRYSRLLAKCEYSIGAA
jgi:hypothetical protein